MVYTLNTGNALSYFLVKKFAKRTDCMSPCCELSFAAMTISPYRGFSLSIVLTELSTKSYDAMAR